MQTNLWRTTACQGLARWSSSKLPGKATRSRSILTQYGRQTYLSTLIDEPQPTTSGDSVRRRSTEVKWLIRARKYGIHSMQQLLAEADFSNNKPFGSKVIDEPQNRDNLNLWTLLLQVNLQTNGPAGGKAIWHAMNWRAKRVKLDPYDRVDLRLLRLLINAGTEDLEFMHRLSTDFVRMELYQSWESMFVDITGAVLVSNPTCMMEFAGPLHKYCLPRRLDIIKLAILAYQAKDPTTVKSFYELLSILPHRNLYDDLSSCVWHLGLPSDAFTMHEILLIRRDLPSSVEVLQPFIQHLANNSEELQPFLTQLEKSGVSFSTQLHRLYAFKKAEAVGHSPEALSFLAGANISPHRQPLSDATIARAFATTAFSFDFILNSLCMIGLIQIGPLSARQIALTAGDIATLQYRFGKLQEKGVDTGASAFVSCLRGVCASGNSNLLSAMITSDLHHDVFEDNTLQLKLLSEYYRNGDIAQLNRTLAILSTGDCGYNAQIRASNNILRTALKLDDLNGINLLVEKMRQLKYFGHESTVRETAELISRFELTDHLTPTESLDHVLFLVGTIQKLMASGTRVPISVWRKPLLLFCREGRIAELEKLVMWLAEWYSDNGTSSKFFHGRLYGKDCDLNAIFDGRFQIRLIGWSVIHHGTFSLDSQPSASGSGEIYPWLRASRILHKLRDEYGVTVLNKKLHRLFVHRLGLAYRKAVHAHRSNQQTATLLNRVSLNILLDTWARYWQIPKRPYWIRLMKSRIIPPVGDSRPGGLHLGDPRPGTPFRLVEAGTYSQEKSSDQARVPRLSRRPLLSGDDIQESVVGYRDLYTASWEDYKKQ